MWFDDYNFEKRFPRLPTLKLKIVRSSLANSAKFLRIPTEQLWTTASVYRTQRQLTGNNSQVRRFVKIVNG